MRYSGDIGFSETIDIGNGIWREQIIARHYTGNVKNYSRNNGISDTINGNIDISNTIDILGDSYILSHLGNIKYATFMGTMWNVKSIKVNYPRLELTIGGVYNGEREEN